MIGGPRFERFCLATLGTSILTNTYTPMQIAIGITAKQKSFIEFLHNFRVTVPYDETPRFKASVAHAAVSQELKLQKHLIEHVLRPDKP